MSVFMGLALECLRKSLGMCQADTSQCLDAWLIHAIRNQVVFAERKEGSRGPREQ